MKKIIRIFAAVTVIFIGIGLSSCTTSGGQKVIKHHPHQH